MIPYALLDWIIGIEIALVILLIIITFLLRYYFYLRNEHNQNMTAQIKKHLEKIADENGTFDLHSFPKKWRRLELLLPVIFSLDNTLKKEAWPTIKKSVADTILLPIARKKYISRLWMNRLLSTQCFELWMESRDDVCVAKLLEDKVSIINLHATVAAVKFGSAKLINLVINNMSQKRRLAQTVYVKIFELAAPETRKYVEERLHTEKDSFARATCYKILVTFKEYNANLDVTSDLQSKNMELRLSAMRYIALAKKQDAIPFLTNLLADPEWEVRAASNRLLGDLHALQAIDEIANGLKDKNWWVRINANTLKNFGEAGLAILNAQSPMKDKYALKQPCMY